MNPRLTDAPVVSGLSQPRQPADWAVGCAVWPPCPAVQPTETVRRARTAAPVRADLLSASSHFTPLLAGSERIFGGSGTLSAPLTLARTSYFAILDRTLGGKEGGCHHPRLVYPLIELELRNKDKRKDRDVLNLTIPDFITLGLILTFLGQVKEKSCFLGRSSFFQITF